LKVIGGPKGLKASEETEYLAKVWLLRELGKKDVDP
jgi:hypothetical protein